MLAKRIIPCLDVKNDKVVKGVGFKNHVIMGDILTLAKHYSEAGADELVFYDITASCEDRVIDYTWVSRVSEVIQIPFCVAGGIRSLFQAEKILEAGADKISINSPATERPVYISELAKHFGTQCVVVGVDSKRLADNYYVYQYTGCEKTTTNTKRLTSEWLQEIDQLGAGEIVLNCMDKDGDQFGYDIEQIRYLQDFVACPLVASGGAGCVADFEALFCQTNATGALAASVFHNGSVELHQLKKFLHERKVRVRVC
jgi:imidazole glycerol-phosphate synthase subunit HisF